MSRSTTNLPCAVILTAMRIEYREVRPYVKNLQEVTGAPRGATYQKGVFKVGNHAWSIGLVEIGTGNLGQGPEVEHAINYFKPNVILFVGVANGMRDVVASGDVVAATQIYDFKSDKSMADFQPRPATVYSAYPLVQIAQAEALKEDWLTFIRPPWRSGVKPKAIVAPIVAIENKKYAENFAHGYQILQRSYDDAVAVEREDSNFLQAVQTYCRRKNTLIIRGIAKNADDKNEPTGDNLRRAAHHASAFAFAILAKMASVYAMPYRTPSPALVPELQAASPMKNIKIFFLMLAKMRNLAKYCNYT
jgi:nucleoside phosphorylase